MIPEAIKNDFTQAIDQAWTQRLQYIRPSQLTIDLANESNPKKVEWWMEMLGVPRELFCQVDLSAGNQSELLSQILALYSKSGTPESIVLMCKLLGATEAEIYAPVLRNGKHYRNAKLKRPNAVSRNASIQRDGVFFRSGLRFHTLRNNTIYRNRTYRRDGYNHEDSAVFLEVTGIVPEKQNEFKTKLKQLFGLFQPARLFLERVFFR